MNRLQLIPYYAYSFFFCLRYLPIRQAWHIPVLIHPTVKIAKLHRGAIRFAGKVQHSMLIFGFEGTIGQSNCKSLISISSEGSLLVKENVSLSRGTRLVITKGMMKIGNDFWCNGDCYFRCTTNITIGNDNIYGWCVSFNTTDGHYVYENDNQKENEGDIVIGDHVWIASCCNISKGVLLPHDCIVSQNSLVKNKFLLPNCLIGGIPAKILKENIKWTRDK